MTPISILYIALFYSFKNKIIAEKHPNVENPGVSEVKEEKQSMYNQKLNWSNFRRLCGSLTYFSFNLAAVTYFNNAIASQ